ncbi:hypothetical protein ACO0J1_00815 [Stenotrophomonas acidaminiphila]|uniref:hypothetical protein n=1 Tax=Stenotrophomonas acidaminiphila TaxID=128780 RepID=UPI003BF09E80
MIKFLEQNHPAHRVNQSLRVQIAAAQGNLIDYKFGSAHDFFERVLQDAKLALQAPAELRDQPVSSLTNLRSKDLGEWVRSYLLGSGAPEQMVNHHAVAVSERVRLLTAFDEPDVVVENTVQKVQEIVQGFPASPEDILCGRNPGDVLDPFILAATQTLMFGGDIEQTIEATVAHKALMMVEGLLGHLHEDVIGQMRGNVRVPEPRGQDQETLNPELNPFPGSDVLQPPYQQGDHFKFHQIKSKTGSAKGGDGRRLGEQLARLRDLYGGEIFYHALIGNTLRGHRSRAGVERAAPGVVVLVGKASFNCLTQTVVGPELLLRLYHSAFTTVASRTGYRVDTMAAAISGHFVEKAQREGEGFLELILEEATEGSATEQDNRLFVGGRRGRTTPR